MAKELPYFKFEPAEWMFGRIQKRSDKSIVAFVNIMAKYWHKECVLNLEDAELDFGKEQIDELIKHKILVSDGGFITIKFLHKQFHHISEDKKKTSKQASEAGKKSAEKRSKSFNDRSTTVQRPLSNRSTTDEQDKIREDKIRENTSPRTFFFTHAEPELEQIQMKSSMDVTEFEKCIEQWSLSVESDRDFYFTENKAEDLRILSARFRKWINSWRDISANKKESKGLLTTVKPARPKPHPDLPDDWWTAKLTDEQKDLIPSNIMAAKISAQSEHIRKQMGI